MSKHQKHAKLTRAKNYLEIGLLGTSCGEIQQWVNAFANQSSLKVAYLDGSHDDSASFPENDSFTYHDLGFVELIRKGSRDQYQQAIDLRSYDLVFVNSNHFEAEKQIVFLNPKKQASVRRRADQLTQVLACISLDDDWLVYDDLSNNIIKNQNEFNSFISARIQIPELKGLVMLGGKSSRMGRDKGQIIYHNKEQRFHMVELIESLGIEVHISVAEGQYESMPNRIEDSFLDLGPMGGILSAFKEFPSNALLVLANDLPKINKNILIQLMQERDTSMVATALVAKGEKFPEPLVCIYEPKAYARLLEFLSLGYSCPRKMLINSEIKLIEVDPKYIENANSPEDYKRIKDGLL
ncbi:NTP transferase domain-containing protein [Flavobacteriaceae bacterium]|nr:NTP transferase domain-containing protein [Flavobacteriaceae bacterium]